MICPPAENLSCLWGSVIREMSIRPDIAELTLCCEVRDKGVVSQHRLRLIGISALSFARHTPLPWQYCELTAIEAARKDEGWLVRMELWSRANSLELQSEQLFLNEVEIR